jgi:hypothetical protein
VAANFGVSVSYIWRKYDRFIWQQRIGLSSSDFSAVTFTPPANACPPGARCESVTYYVPNFPLPSPYVLTNQPDYNRKYHSLEAIVRKRLANRWMMTSSYAYNTTTSFYTSPAAYQDPTNIDKLNGAQYAPETAASSLSNVFLNAKHMLRFAGSYRLWRDIGVAAAYDLRQGYPFVPSINIGSRPNQAGGIAVLLDPLGAVRLPTFQTLDFRVDKMFTFRRLTLHPALDIFNVFNGNTILSRRRNQNASNANQVNATLAPRVARIGLLLTF